MVKCGDAGLQFSVSRVRVSLVKASSEFWMERVNADHCPVWDGALSVK